MPEVAEVRRRLRRVLERARAESKRRRERVDAAEIDGRRVLAEVVMPVVHTLANVLKSEGRPCRVETPTGAVRLLAERSPDRYVEVVLDTAHEPPALLVRASRPRGRGVLVDEGVLRADPELASLTEDDVLDRLLDELASMLD